MLIKLNEELVERLSKELQGLSERDKSFFHPHKFDIKSLEDLIKEKGNHYYVYLDDSGRFVGYGMLRTFGKYGIPTLGIVILREHRGYSHGKKLIEELIDKAHELGYQKIRLKAYHSNKIAYELYKKVGFKQIGKDKGREIWMEYNNQK